MTKAVSAILPLFVFAMATSAFAQGKIDTNKDMTETVKVTVSGGLDLDFVYRDHGLNSALAGGGADDTTFVHGQFHLRVDVDLTEKVKVLLQVENPRLEGGAFADIVGGNPEGLGAAGGVRLRHARITVGEVLDPSITVSAGTQDWAFNVRGKGGSLFWDPANAPSIATYIATGGSTSGQTPSVSAFDQLMPAGVGIHYDREAFHLNVLLLPAIIEGGDASHDESAYLASFFYDLTTMGAGSRVGAIVAINHFGGFSHSSTMYTIGGGVALNGLVENLELYAELYFQTGEISSAGSGLDAGGLAFMVGAEYKFTGDNNLWVGVNITSLSGDDDTTDADNDSFLSYSSVNDLMIIEDQWYGLGWHSNVLALKFSGGLSLSVGQGKNNVDVKIVLGLFTTSEDVVGVGSSSEDALGTEVDGTITYWLSKQVSLTGGIGALFGSDILEGMGGGSGVDRADDSSFLGTVGINARF